MISYMITLILVLTFFLSGYILQALKRLITLTIKLFLNILSFFGIKIKAREKSLKVSDDFKKTYKEIKLVKLSNKNLKERSSIDWLNLGLFCACLLLIIINLKVISGNAISNWLFHLIENLNIVKTSIDMNTFFTATLFSGLSFSVTKLLQRWKNTKEQRVEKRNNKLKFKVLKLMNTKELLEEAKKKDEIKRNELK